jgi:hypothetical protein
MAKTVTISELPPATGLTATAVSGGSLVAGTTYYYRLYAVEYYSATLLGSNSTAYSVLSNEVSATCDAINKSVKLDWTPPTKIKSANYLAYIVLRTTVAGDYSGLGHMVRIASTDPALATTLNNAITCTDAGTQTNVDSMVFPNGIPMVEVDGGADADRIDEEFIYQEYVAQGKAANFAVKTAFTKGIGNQYFFKGFFRFGFIAACFWKINGGRTVTIEGRSMQNTASNMSNLAIGSPSTGNGAVLGFIGCNGSVDRIEGTFNIYNSKIIDLANSEGITGGTEYYSSACFNGFSASTASIISKSSLYSFGGNTSLSGIIAVDDCQMEMGGRIESGYVVVTNSKWCGNSLYAYGNQYAQVKDVTFTASVYELFFHGSTANKVIDLIDFTGTYTPLRSGSASNPTYSWYYRRWTLNATLVDVTNSPIAAVNVSAFDVNGMSSIFEDSGILFNDFNQTDTSATTTAAPDAISIGDIILSGPERMAVTNKSGVTLAITRGQQNSVAIYHSAYNKKIYIQRNTIVTGADGKIPEQYLTAETYRGKAAGDPYTYDTVVYTPHKIVIRKYGYNFFGITTTVAEPIALKQILAVNPFVVADATTAGAYLGIAIDPVTLVIYISTAHTMQEVYDYSQWWASQAGNMYHPEPIVTIDGINFALKADWDFIIDGVVLSTTNKAVSCSGTGTYSVINGGDFTGVLSDAAHTRVKITAPNLIDGTRVYVINDTMGVEVDNSVVAGGNGYVFVADIPSATLAAGNLIMLFATYCSGLMAKRELFTSGLMMSVGLQLVDTQEDWQEYINMGIDGSTVTEFVADYPNIEVDINDSDNVTTKQRLIAWWIHNLTTADGIRFFFEGITVEDVSNYRINDAVTNIYLDNLNATPLKFTDEARLYKASGATVIAAASNSIQLDSGKVYTVNQADILLAISGIPTAEENAEATMEYTR